MLTSNHHYKCIILVIASHTPTYDSFKNLWEYNLSINALNWNEYAVVYMYNGSKDGFHMEGSNIYFDYDEDMHGLFKKLIGTLKYLAAQNTTYDYIFRTNLSSLIDWKLFMQYVHKIPARSGYLCGSFFAGNMVSGSGFFMTPDITQMLVSNASEIQKTEYDDVDINNFLMKQGVQTVPLGRLDIQSRIDVEQICSFKSNGNFHYRFRCCEDRSTDIKNMHEVIHILANDTCSGPITVEAFTQNAAHFTPYCVLDQVALVTLSISVLVCLVMLLCKLLLSTR